MIYWSWKDDGDPVTTTLPDQEVLLTLRDLERRDVTQLRPELHPPPFALGWRQQDLPGLGEAEPQLAGQVQRRLNLLKLLTGLCLLTSCPSPGLKTGLTSVWSQENFTLNARQKCQAGEVVVAVADVQLALLLNLAETHGFVKDRTAAVTRLQRIAVCQIDEPEGCCLGSMCAGPRKGELAARKAGCSGDGWAWVALKWPPICGPEWPDEPHCVPPGTPRSSRVWDNDLLLELGLVAARRLNIPFSADHTDAWTTGPVTKAIEQWRRLR